MKIQNRTEQTKYTFLNATFWYNWLIYSPSLYKKKEKKRIVSLKSTSDRENYLDCFLKHKQTKPQKTDTF